MSSEAINSLFSQIAYQVNNQERVQMLRTNGLEHDWFVDSRYSNENNAVFRNYKNKQVIVAVRGTDFKRGLDPLLSDLANDTLIAAGLSKIGGRYQETRDLIEQLQRDVNYSTYDISLTGHSLGGTTANHVGIDLDLPSTVFNPGASPLEYLDDYLLGPNAAERERAQDNQIIRTRSDLVSASILLNPYQRVTKTIDTRMEGSWGGHKIGNFITPIPPRTFEWSAPTAIVEGRDYGGVRSRREQIR